MPKKPPPPRFDCSGLTHEEIRYYSGAPSTRRTVGGTQITPESRLDFIIYIERLHRQRKAEANFWSQIR